MQHVVLGMLKQLFLEIYSIDSCNQKQLPGLFHEKAVLKTFAIFTGKQLCWSLFLINLQALRPQVTIFLRTPILKTSANEFFLCNSPVLSTIVFQIHNKLLFHVQLSLLQNIFCVISVDNKI